ncbi:hypothetical protein BDV41DRAFT_526817 [Aspergillus transmontanensis]|uniref:VWFA domain-containing protein n=1 Tax=Aspergillus transmontanensis TaxID=1034304 RepID=A0A5N6W9L7_9EURO|nr:hypothetical protein BDV41DRAFT_526817 [Aspergillus transmontanensis]
MEVLPAKAEQHDLLLVVDATGSMSSFLESLRASIRQIVSMSVLTCCFSRIGLLAYRDYNTQDLLQWSGWYDASPDATGTQPDLLEIAASLQTEGNLDNPEAAKTGLAKAYELMRPDARTVILFYTDAPPHMAGNAQLSPLWQGRGNDTSEHEALSDPTSYGGFGPVFNDWVSACNLLRDGEKKAQVFCLLEPGMSHSLVSYYNYLCTMTQGSCILLHDSLPSVITKVTIQILLAWMRIGKKAVEDAGEETYPQLISYPDLTGIDSIRSERDEEACLFFPTPGCSGPAGGLKIQHLSPYIMEKYIHKKGSPVADFAKLWVTDSSYKELVVKHLKHIITEDVTVIAVNAVFATLWRNICSDRTHPARSELLNAFSLHVSRIKNDEDRSRMTEWLEVSYDYSGDVEELINSVPEAERFPCVCLDPTLTFKHTNPIADLRGQQETADITKFTRAELLEIGRSCEPNILCRLGRVLTQLTYIESPADMPEHLAIMTHREVPRIPMALAKDEYNRRFWEILLHIVVPGTMLSSRPASILAALSLKLGITPLISAAEIEVLAMRDKWNNIEVPETWTVSCLSLLLDADRKYQQRQALEQAMDDAGEVAAAVIKPLTLLKPSDRELFEKLIAYRFLELNLHTTVTAQIAWRPEKTTLPIGPLVTCRTCQYPRSVTMMGRDEQCGMCLSGFPEAYGATKEDTEQTPMTWVECYTPTCRAQYVVYDVGELRVRPKCHYCRARNASKPTKDAQHPLHDAPCVECHRCLSRIIWPEPYRPANVSEADFVCPACTAGRQTVVNEETSAEQLAGENTLSWLIEDSLQPDGHVFSNRSVYDTVSTVGPDNFVSRITLFPVSNPHLTVRGKLIQNSQTIISELQSFVSRHRSARAACSLCFSNFHPTALSSACGRQGCQERICKDCLSHWYGLNTAGRMINTAALACPFCRRFPSAKTLAKHDMGIHAVAHLQAAIEDRGTWIYAWCQACATAKPYLERVCAQGTPAEVTSWCCEDCFIPQNNHGSVPQNSRARLCPGCGVMTEKISGCGHIECEVEGCLTHWCYFCGDKFEEDAIYTHMNEAHGTIYDQEDELYYDIDD